MRMIEQKMGVTKKVKKVIIIITGNCFTTARAHLCMLAWKKNFFPGEFFSPFWSPETINSRFTQRAPPNVWSFKSTVGWARVVEGDGGVGGEIAPSHEKGKEIKLLQRRKILGKKRRKKLARAKKNWQQGHIKLLTESAKSWDCVEWVAEKQEEKEKDRKWGEEGKGGMAC